MTKRAVLIDGQQLMRDGVARIVRDELGFDEVRQAGDLQSGLELIAGEDVVELVIADFEAPGSRGPDSVGALVKTAPPDACVVVMSASEAREDVLESLAAGANGYIPKSMSAQEVIEALKQVLDGGMFVPRMLARREAPPRPRRNLARVERLTPRQRQVLDRVLLGRSCREIARDLELAEGTVKLHLAAIYRALGARTRAEALAKLI